VAYTNAEARRQLLDAVARATTDIGAALAHLGAAYEQVDEAAGDRLEAELFRPLRTAFGQAQRTYATYARQHALPTRTFAAREPPVESALEAIETAAAAIARADVELAELQDSMLPVEVGDPALRAGLTRVRQLLAEAALRMRAFTRTLGR